MYIGAIDEDVRRIQAIKQIQSKNITDIKSQDAINIMRKYGVKLSSNDIIVRQPKQYSGKTQSNVEVKYTKNDGTKIYGIKEELVTAPKGSTPNPYAKVDYSQVGKELAQRDLIKLREQEKSRRLLENPKTRLAETQNIILTNPDILQYKESEVKRIQEQQKIAKTLEYKKKVDYEYKLRDTFGKQGKILDTSTGEYIVKTPTRQELLFKDTSAPISATIYPANIKNQPKEELITFSYPKSFIDEKIITPAKKYINEKIINPAKKYIASERAKRDDSNLNLKVIGAGGFKDVNLKDTRRTFKEIAPDYAPKIKEFAEKRYIDLNIDTIKRQRQKSPEFKDFKVLDQGGFKDITLEDTRLKYAEIEQQGLGAIAGGYDDFREKPAKYVAIALSPYALRVIGSGLSVAYGKTLIFAGDKAYKLSPLFGATTVKTGLVSGKIASISFKTAMVSIYAYEKNKEFKQQNTLYNQGKVIGITGAEIGTFAFGSYATKGLQVGFEKSLEYLRGRLEVRGSFDYASQRNIKIIDESAKLSNELTKLNIKPSSDIQFKNVKSITPKQINIAKTKLISEKAIIQGSSTQPSFYSNKLGNEFIKTKGKFGDIDYFIKSGKPIKGLKSVSDVHTYGERYLFRKSPFTTSEVKTPSGQLITSFSEQSGKLFSGMTTQRVNPKTGKLEFYRAEEDLTKLLFQFKGASEKGLSSSIAQKSFNEITQISQKLPENTFPRSIIKSSKQPNDIFNLDKFNKAFYKSQSFSKINIQAPIITKYGKSTNINLSPSSSFSHSPSMSISSSSSPSFSHSPSISISSSSSPSFSHSPSISRSYSPSPSFSPSPSISISSSPSPSFSHSPSISRSYSPSPSFSPSQSYNIIQQTKSINSFNQFSKIKPKLNIKIPKFSFKQVKVTTPTLRAVSFGIKKSKSKNKKFGFYTGLEERGI